MELFIYCIETILGLLAFYLLAVFIDTTDFRINTKPLTPELEEKFLKMFSGKVKWYGGKEYVEYEGTLYIVDEDHSGPGLYHFRLENRTYYYKYRVKRGTQLHRAIKHAIHDREGRFE